MAYIFDCYDNAGGQSLTTGTVTLNLDTTRLEYPSGSSSPFDLTSDVLTISETANYIFHYRASADYSSGTPSAADTIYIYLDRDTGSGYVEVDGSRASLMPATNTTDTATATASVALAVSSGDKFRVRIVTAASATYQTIADYAGLMCWRDETGGGGGGAPTDASYLVAASDSGLSDERVAASGEGISFSSTSSGADATWALNFPGLTTYTGAGSSDFICVYDNTAKEHKKLTWSELFLVRDVQQVAGQALAAMGAPPEACIGLLEHIDANITPADLSGDRAADVVTILEDYRSNGTNAGLVDERSQIALNRAIWRIKRFQSFEDGTA